ncbi:hypothetical protein E2C01_024565 [Portunus trituberculatus]|uniref:Uncharacterized protein n=1 Tax=Portunus trituberculatus TaxID=210409 RepID=A0A5B7EAN0_PORTR|nr:hypothetical protein [Portunus trituberculatus]
MGGETRPSCRVIVSVPPVNILLLSLPLPSPFPLPDLSPHTRVTILVPLTPNTRPLDTTSTLRLAGISPLTESRTSSFSTPGLHGRLFLTLTADKSMA